MYAAPPEIVARISPPGLVFLGTTVDLVCEATSGSEPISFSWSDNNGVEISTNRRVSVSFTRNRYGTYRCTASNEFGRASSVSTEVEVLQGA